ncbi:MAG: 3-dehydroquinate synthase [Pseudomonadota bacterium]
MRQETVSVGLGDRSYDVLIGQDLLETAGHLIADQLSRKFVAIVTDENVVSAQAARLKAGLDEAGITYRVIALPPGEATKSWSQLEALTDQLLALGLERNDTLLAFGGGVIGDLAGFSASLLRRGCRFVQIPTSLLAQVDSSVGGKTAINTKFGKNLIGAFYQPTRVLADVTCLTTLPTREVKAGYAEIVKYGALGDADFFHWLSRNGSRVLSLKPGAVIDAVRVSVEAKARIVSADERERGKRALLNLGHTFGHAIEALLEYDGRVLHGEAVALGMCLAFDLSAEIGICPAEDAQALRRHLKDAGLPVTFADLPGGNEFSAAAFVDTMMQDKKVDQGKLVLILAERLGAAAIRTDIDPATVHQFLIKQGLQT